MAVSAPVGAGDTSLSRLASKRVGDFERLPKWLNLVPMVAQWLWLGLRHGSVTLPSSANPHITAGGLVGDTKSEYFHCMGALARSKVADFVVFHAHGAASLAAATTRPPWTACFASAATCSPHVFGACCATCAAFT
ncbi:MAG: hypothetical protein ABIU96_03725, partial [Rhodanobacter sp.]